MAYEMARGESQAEERNVSLKVRSEILLLLVFPNCDTGNQKEHDANRNDNVK